MFVYAHQLGWAKQHVSFGFVVVEYTLPASASASVVKRFSMQEGCVMRRLGLRLVGRTLEAARLLPAKEAFRLLDPSGKGYITEAALAKVGYRWLVTFISLSTSGLRSCRGGCWRAWCSWLLRRLLVRRRPCWLCLLRCSQARCTDQVLATYVMSRFLWSSCCTRLTPRLLQDGPYLG